MTKTLYTNKRLWLVMVTIALAVIASLVFSLDPVAAQSAATKQYGEATSPADASASPSASVEPTDGSGGEGSIGKSAGGDDGVSQGSVTNVEQREAPSGPNGDSSSGAPDADSGRGGEGSDPAASEVGTPLGEAASPNDSTSSHEGGAAGSDSGPIGPSVLPDSFSQGEQPESENTATPSVPQAAGEGFLSGLNELRRALESLREALTTVFPFAPELPAQPEAGASTTAPPSATQSGGEDSNPAQQDLPGSAHANPPRSAPPSTPAASSSGADNNSRWSEAVTRVINYDYTKLFSPLNFP